MAPGPPRPSLLHKLTTELGLRTILHAPADLHLIYLTRFLRMAAYGGVSLVLALFFAALSVPDARIGLFMTLTLLGDVGLSLALTLVADRLGRRRVLLLGCGGMVVAGAVFANASAYWVLLGAAVVGVVSVSGNEIGPFRAVEESALAGLVGERERSEVFGWYVVVGTMGSALGLAGAGWVVEACKRREGWVELDAFRVVFWGYGAVGVVKAGLTLLLSARCEVDGYGGGGAAAGRGEYATVGSGGGRSGRKDAAAEDAEESERDVFLTPSRSSDEGPADDDERPLPPTPPTPAPPPKPKMGFAQLSAETRWMMLKLCALFFVDSLASGMVPYSLINFYLDRKFGLPKSTLGGIVAATWVTSSIGNIFAASIARRIGLVQTMVFTHLPSAVFLALIPAAPVVWLTAILMVLRGTLASMDQAPRSAFLSLVVKPEERTAVMGIVNVVKTLSQSGGPSVTGFLAGTDRFWIAFVVAGAMKAAYDCGLLTLFVKVERKAEGAIKLDRRETRQLADEFELDTEDEASDSGDEGRGKRRDSAA
ncbi:mfs general substrate transporter [Diplodia corticola]|uniref:Mfs general substrate transporter n=1 Tax=Diplodia corticola TaxID=236234 RepID=A0A1J9RVA3_9PEZI|nr:mfs general substrate transporter [Diplodia corticola]OJD36531.1 mfs general substrate transporter [Diplodia corticola]